MERAGEINFFKKFVRYRFEGVPFLLGDIQAYINVDGNEWNELEGVMERRYRGGQVAAGGKSLRRQGGGENQSTGGGSNLRREERCLVHFDRKKAGKNAVGYISCPLIFTKVSGARCCFPQFSSDVTETWKSQVICPESHQRTQVFRPKGCFEPQL